MIRQRQLNTGFSLVEFIVILSLFAIMASVVSLDFQNFRDSIERGNLATDIGLSYRQMQVYGISASNREVGGEGFDTDDGSVQSLVSLDLLADESIYGVQLDLNDQTIFLYQEVANAPDAFDTGADVLVDALSISGNNQVLRICASEDDTQPRISGTNGSCNFALGSSGEEIDIGTFVTTFKRPFPDATFYGSEFSVGFVPQTVLLVIGQEGQDPTEFEYLYIDAAGLIQLANPEIV
jgi:type II secretory pathway pseudopilin PulG